MIVDSVWYDFNKYIKEELFVKTLVWIDKREAKFDEIPEKKGVYLVACDCKNNKSIVVYVGQTENLRRRTKVHWSDNEQNKELKNAIAKYRSAFKVVYAEVDSLNDLNGIEKYLFDYYEPQFTDRRPDAEPIEVVPPNSVQKGSVNF